MIKKCIPLLMIIFVAFTVSTVWAEPKINPGKWEITSTTQIPGMPGGHSISNQQCITEENLIPMNQNPTQECRVEDMVVRGNTVSWKIYCNTPGGEMKGTGQVTYSDTQMTGTMEMTIAGTGMQVKNIFSGHRIGECDD